MTGRRPGRRADLGAVTAETALVLPVLVLVLGAALGVLRVVVADLRCVDAAREAARALARGDAPSTVRSIAERGAPAGAGVAVASSAGLVTVTVTARVDGLGRLLPAWEVRATASTPTEGVGLTR